VASGTWGRRVHDGVLRFDDEDEQRLVATVRLSSMRDYHDR
jgi:hypothetical protein